MKSQEGSSSNYQEQIRQSLDEELFLALKEEIKRDNEDLQMQLSNIEPKVNANIIVDIYTNSTSDLDREMSAII